MKKLRDGERIGADEDHRRRRHEEEAGRACRSRVRDFEHNRHRGLGRVDEGTAGRNEVDKAEGTSVERYDTVSYSDFSA